MKRFYRANQSGKRIRGTEASNPTASWAKLEKLSGLTRATLKEQGYKVKLVIDLEESDAATAVDVIEAVGPEPVGKIVGFLRKLFG